MLSATFWAPIVGIAGVCVVWAFKSPGRGSFWTAVVLLAVQWLFVAFAWSQWPDDAALPAVVLADAVVCGVLGALILRRVRNHRPPGASEPVMTAGLPGTPAPNSHLRPCSACLRMISAAAPVCPTCGHPQPPSAPL